MHRLPLSALALATLTGATSAGTPPTEYEWLRLDRELETLEASLTPQDEGDPAVVVSAWMKTHYDNNSDADISGFGFEGIRLNVDGQIGDYKVKISADSKGGEFSVRDAYARTPLAEGIGLQVGQFKSRFLYSYYHSDQSMVFYRRNAIASAWGTRDTGVQVDGRFGPILGILQLQNGDDSAGDEWAMTAKLQWAAIGKMLEKQSGGFGTDAETALTFGAGYAEDTTVDNSSAYVVEAVFVTGPLFMAAEVVPHDDGFAGIDSGLASKVDAAGFADDVPWDVAAAWMLTDRWELAADYQDNDDPANTTTVRGGVNYYVNGHATKWQLNFASTSSDDAAEEADLLTLGLVIEV
jgi:hypothetical protein